MTPLVEMRDISISFGGIRAVDGVTVDLYPGEVVGLLGHNGAGKSTLIKVLSGAYQADSGDILINGEKAEIRSPRDARRYNIETIYQTLALADNLNAAQNLFLGREIVTPLGFVDDDRMEAETRKIMGRLNPNFAKFSAPVKALSGGQRQSVAIARAVYFNARILIMDEPTAALGVRETQMVAELIEVTVEVVESARLENALEVMRLVADEIAEGHANAGQRTLVEGDERITERDEQQQLGEVEHLLAHTVAREHHLDALPRNDNRRQGHEETVAEAEEFRLMSR